MLLVLLKSLKIVSRVLGIGKPKPQPLSHKIAVKTMHCLFSAIPFIAGVDKFFNVITNWEKYVPPVITQVVEPKRLMPAIGISEMFVGTMVAVNPKIGAPLLILMLSSISASLLTIPKQLHIMFLDLSLAICVGVFYMLMLDGDN